MAPLAAPSPELPPAVARVLQFVEAAREALARDLRSIAGGGAERRLRPRAEALR